jgi:hypothetical protein
MLCNGSKGKISLGTWHSSDHVVFNATLVASSKNLKHSAVSPGGGPGVVAEPIRISARINSPSSDLHTVTSKILTGSVVLIDSGLVGKEVLIDREAGFNGTVGHDLSHDVSLI